MIILFLTFFRSKKTTEKILFWQSNFHEFFAGPSLRRFSSVRVHYTVYVSFPSSSERKRQPCSPAHCQLPEPAVLCHASHRWVIEVYRKPPNAPQVAPELKIALLDHKLLCERQKPHESPYGRLSLSIRFFASRNLFSNFSMMIFVLSKCVSSTLVFL